MLFNIEADEGALIVGYVVPDAFTGSPSVRISDGNRELLVLQCREERPALVAAGRHETGRCGFRIDETIIPNLPQQEALELHDQETNLLIYRRRPSSEIIKKRILRLETSLFPLWRLDDAIEKRFQYFHKGVERYGRETTMQLFLLSNSTSLYLSGRLLLKTYENYVDETVHCAALLRDPYMELAERLLTLKHMGKLGKELLGERDLLAFEPAIAFAEVIEHDERALHRAFSTMPRAVIANFANPLTRQLAARSADDVPTKGAIATSLSTLSSFAVLGLRENCDLFLAQLADLVGLPAEALPLIPDFIKTAELAQLLRGVPEAGLLIEQDREVYHHVKAAIEHALAE